MKIYPSLPRQIVEGWFSSNQSHPANERVDFHYHDVEELLEVTRGNIAFFPLSDQKLRFSLATGSVLRIPRGEVHRADIGNAGVEYRMYLPVELSNAFSNRLNANEIEMLRTNLEFPIQEDNKNGQAADFFSRNLSEGLAFCRADGSVIGKDSFLRSGFTFRDRSNSGTVNVLNRTPNGILLSTVVTTDSSSHAPKHFNNMRLFVDENGVWKCRMWVNFPESLM